MVHAYICDVCGNLSQWTDNHMSVLRPYGHGEPYTWGESYFITCSSECRKKSRQPFIDWLGKKSGWSPKSAAKNFDSTLGDRFTNE